MWLIMHLYTQSLLTSKLLDIRTKRAIKNFKKIEFNISCKFFEISSFTSLSICKFFAQIENNLSRVIQTINCFMNNSTHTHGFYFKIYVIPSWVLLIKVFYVKSKNLTVTLSKTLLHIRNQKWNPWASIYSRTRY